MVLLVAFGACGDTFFIEGEAMPVFAHPTDPAGWIADYQSVWRNIFGHNSSGSDHGIFTDRMAANDRCIRTDRSSFSDMRFQIPVLTGNGTAGIDHVRKNTTGSQKDIIPASHTGIDGDIVLHLHIISQDDLRRDYDILPDIAIPTDRAPRHDMGKMPDARTLPDRASGIDNGCFVCLICCHLFIY